MIVGDESGAVPIDAPRNQRRGLVWALVLVGLAALVALVVFIVVPLTPSFELRNANVHTNSSRFITENFLIENGSMVDQRILAADLDAPGVHVVRTNAPLTISSSGEMWVRVTYRVTDCKAAVAAETDAPFPMHLRLERWWGVRTVTVADHGSDYPGPYDICP